jgi:hypothetical protein
MFYLRPLDRLPAPLHKPALLDDLSHTLDRCAHANLDAAYLTFPDLALVFIAVGILLMTNSIKPFLDGCAAANLPGFLYKILVMSGKVSALDVVRHMLRSVRLLSLDMGGVGHRWTVAFLIMADCIVAHIFSVEGGRETAGKECKGNGGRRAVPFAGECRAYK